ncbi:hypothetical protein [Nocardiopsis sp. CNT312]|uniref:hypothetical protein n=1 Tax=Nocardiopsis sp. CNT312 TaxID=1137268 RepID=UPI0012DC3198|nr:hypothetical protein [Nocardiopsis sp. CNT312]
MTKVEWSLIDWDDFEHLVSIFICLDNPRAQRIKPQQGDGGIDVFVPSEGRRGVIDVYQVKAFSGNIDSDRRSQIKRSFTRVVEFTGSEKIKLENWYVVAPILPMNKDEKWLQEMTKEELVNCEWRGLGHLDSWAAKYPEVIDYYIHNDGRRLEHRVAELTALLRTSMKINNAASEGSEGEYPGISPGEVIGTLESLGRMLNKSDPHFRYGFSVDSVLPYIPDEPFLVAVEQTGQAGCFVTVKIYAKFAEALNERPAPIKINLAIDPGSKLEQDFLDFQKYGKPFSAPLGSASAEFDLPGGIGGGLWEGAGITISRTSEDEGVSHQVRIQVLDSSDTVLESCKVNMGKPTFGIDGKGSRFFGIEENGVFEVEILVDAETEFMSFTIRQLDITGKWPSLVVAPLRLLSEVKHPNKVRFARPFGPVNHQAILIPQEISHATGENLVLQFVEAL